jgi:hypothetical protein
MLNHHRNLLYEQPMHICYARQNKNSWKPISEGKSDVLQEVRTVFILLVITGHQLLMVEKTN